MGHLFSFRSLKALIFPLVLGLLLTACGKAAPEPEIQKPSLSEDPGTFILTFLTIGKGDAFLLETPEDGYYLIDTGKSQDYVQIARALRVKNIDTLDGIFLTHGHKDHAGSLSTLLQAFPTEAVYYWAEDHFSYKEIFPEEIVPRFSTKLISLRSGEVLSLNGISAEVWLPPLPDPENENNNSLVLMLTHGNHRFLMMGDAEKEEEALLLQSPMDLRADVLKLGHHGEDDASTPAFLDRVQPKLGLIAGNADENPESMDPVITKRLQQRDIEILYSECDGLGYEIVSQGQTLKTRVLKDLTFPASLHLRFSQVDRAGQRISIINDGTETADLSGCLIRSVRRDELYLFPERTLLQPGETITVACRDAELPGDLTWDADSVWQKKRDEARLYDRNLNLLDSNLP